MRIVGTPLLIQVAAVFMLWLQPMYAQTRQWETIAEFDNAITAIEALNDSTLLIGIHQQGDINGLGSSSLVYLQHEAVVWKLRLDSVPLPYFNYPHGDIKDIFVVSEDEIWLAFQYGYSMRVNLESRTFQLLPLSPIHWFSQSQDGTIIAGDRYRSINNGETWDTIPKAGLPTEGFNAVVGGNDAEFYATAGLSGLWASTNGGITWVHKPQLLLQNPNDSLTGAGPLLFLYPNQDILVYAANSWTIEGKNVALYKSTDDGESWRSVLPFTEHHWIIYGSYLSTTAVWAETKGHTTLSITSNQGDSWYEETQQGLPEKSLIYTTCLYKNSLFASFSNDYYLYKLDISQHSSVDIHHKISTSELRACPNPSRSKKTLITLTTPHPESIGIQLYNVLGQPVMKKDWGNLNAGVSTIELDLGIIPSGLYWLSVVNANGVPVQSIPLVVQ